MHTMIALAIKKGCAERGENEPTCKKLMKC